MGYWNEVDPKETREIIQRERDSFFTRQRDALEEAGGRFAKITPQKVTGAEPISQVPQQPPNSPWSQPDRNPEPPFGDVNEMEPTGSYAEVARSLLEQPTADPATTESNLPVVAADRVGSEPVSSPSALTKTGSPNSQQLRRSPEDVGSAGSGSSSPTLPATHSRIKRRF
jgi:hypothetical protein